MILPITWFSYPKNMVNCLCRRSVTKIWSRHTHIETQRESANCGQGTTDANAEPRDTFMESKQKTIMSGSSALKPFFVLVVYVFVVVPLMSVCVYNVDRKSTRLNSSHT